VRLSRVTQFPRSVTQLASTGVMEFSGGASAIPQGASTSWISQPGVIPSLARVVRRDEVG